MLAAHAIADAFARRDFGFDDYGRRIAASAVGWELRRNWLAAGLFYRRLREGGEPPFPSSYGSH